MDEIDEVFARLQQWWEALPPESQNEIVLLGQNAPLKDSYAMRLLDLWPDACLTRNPARDNYRPSFLLSGVTWRFVQLHHWWSTKSPNSRQQILDDLDSPTAWHDYGTELVQEFDQLVPEARYRYADQPIQSPTASFTPEVSAFLRTVAPVDERQ